jgi:PilZ domain
MVSLNSDSMSALPRQENRRYQRVKVDLLGRYMLEDRREFPCQVIDMSPGGMAVIAPQCGRPGERIVAYIDQIGRLEGTIARTFPSGFSMSIAASQRKREKLSAQLTWLANRQILDLPEDRRHERIIGRDQKTSVTMENGVEEECNLLDLSVSGVAVMSDSRPRIGSPVRVGRAPGRVVRHLENGFAVEFSRVISNPDLLKDAFDGL